MDINLNTEAMQKLVEKAIFDGLTPEAREELLKSAIKSLLDTPINPSSYGPKVSILVGIFQDAAQRVARDVVTEKLGKDPEFTKNLQDLFADVSKKLFDLPLREKLVEKISTSVIEGLNLRDY